MKACIFRGLMNGVIMVELIGIGRFRLATVAKSGARPSQRCPSQSEADGFLAVSQYKAGAHVTREAQSSHVRNAPINASELTETVSLAAKVLGQSAVATAAALLVRDRYLNRMQRAWEIPCQGGGGAGQTIQKAALYGLLS